ncbi:hypothetical protein LSUB1_G005603 [Lachnellula subtilissima]|uniref:Uncharacterized protein n=1 Tax=Lachnellula subtilissima TaxID=602034 RepID=A0A8H8RKM2_9HELO|nr:hypothetical protein LSUB1_G005603 [Lachnellula subtilissima]
MRSSTPLFAIALFLSIPNVKANSLDTSCWYETNNQIQSSQGGPCGVISPGTGYKTCCAVNDTCLADGICQYTHAGPTQGQTTGYYVGGCTDPSLNSPNCNTHCSSFNFTDIVYNKTTDRWHCCGSTDGIIHCDDPEPEEFDAPGPVHLGHGYYTVPSVVSTTAASISTHTHTSSTSDPSAPVGVSASASASAISVSKSTSSAGTLSTGAKAGIGIGSAIGGLVIIGLMIFFAMRHRRNKQGSYSGAEVGPSPVTDRGALVERHPVVGHRPELGNMQVNMEHIVRSPMSQNSTAYSDISSGMGDLPVVPISEDSRSGYGSREYPPEKESYGAETILGRQELRGNDAPRHELA